MADRKGQGGAESFARQRQYDYRAVSLPALVSSRIGPAIDLLDLATKIRAPSQDAGWCRTPTWFLPPKPEQGRRPNPAGNRKRCGEGCQAKWETAFSMASQRRNGKANPRKSEIFSYLRAQTYSELSGLSGMRLLRTAELVGMCRRDPSDELEFAAPKAKRRVSPLSLRGSQLWMILKCGALPTLQPSS